MRCAMTEPVVERSTKRRTRLPSITPSGPVATLSTMSGVGRLTITVSAASATSLGERAATAAERRDVADRLLADVVDDDLVSGLDQPPRHVRAHIAETDEADVHENLLLPLPLVGRGRGSEAARKRRRFHAASRFPTLPSQEAGKFRAHLFGVLAERRHRSIAPRRRGALLGRRRIGHRPARRADRDAAQVRMAPKLGRTVDPRESDVGGGELLRRASSASSAPNTAATLAVGFSAALDALDIGGERRIGRERRIVQNLLRPARAIRGRFEWR